MNFFNYVNEKKLIILIISLSLNLIFILVCGILSWSLFNYECDLPMTSDIVNDPETTEEISSKIYVDVKGEVKNPGVYEVSNVNIIDDVIKLAGGFTKSAYKNNINLSKKVTDELVIYVYSNSEYKKLNEDNVEIKECVCPEYNISDCIESGSSEIINNNTFNSEIEDKNDDKENIKKLININTATIDELMTLPGIGESKAKAIIEYRIKTLFNKIDDIKNVSGIGEAVFEKIRDYITV